MAKRLHEARLNRRDMLQKVRIALHFVPDFITCMHNGSVILTTECVTNLLQGHARFGAAKVHGNLAGMGHSVGSLLGFHVFETKAEIIGHDLLNLFYSYRFGFAAGQQVF